MNHLIFLFDDDEIIIKSIKKIKIDFLNNQTISKKFLIYHQTNQTFKFKRYIEFDSPKLIDFR